jgi:hypothetical protein
MADAATEVRSNNLRLRVFPLGRKKRTAAQFCYLTAGRSAFGQSEVLSSVRRERKDTSNVTSVALDPGSCTARDLRRCGAAAEHFRSGLHGRVKLRLLSEEHSVPSHSADQSSSPAAAAAPALGDGLAVSPALLAFSAAGKGDDLTATAGANSPATGTGTGTGDVTGKTSSISGAYIYGYDSAGNPTLTDAGCAPDFEFPG